jgi:hypothetical protein
MGLTLVQKIGGSITCLPGFHRIPSAPVRKWSKALEEIQVGNHLWAECDLHHRSCTRAAVGCRQQVVLHRKTSLISWVARAEQAGIFHANQWVGSAVVGERGSKQEKEFACGLGVDLKRGSSFRSARGQSCDGQAG